MQQSPPGNYPYSKVELPVVWSATTFFANVITARKKEESRQIHASAHETVNCEQCADSALTWGQQVDHFPAGAARPAEYVLQLAAHRASFMTTRDQLHTEPMATEHAGLSS